MKTLIATVVLAVLATGQAMAATQQEKMRQCNADARTKALKGEDRRAFMSQCLAVTEQEKAERLAQKDKARSCAAEARSRSLKGEERRSFLSQCTAA